MGDALILRNGGGVSLGRAHAEEWAAGGTPIIAAPPNGHAGAAGRPANLRHRAPPMTS